MNRDELLQALQEYDAADLEKALQAARASKQAREEEFYFLHYFFGQIRVEENNCAVIKIPISDTIMNPLRIVHGGVTALLCDNAMGYISFLQAGRPGVTINMNISYHKPGRGKYLIAKAELVAEGSKLNTTRCEVHDDQGTLVATATGTFYHYRKGVE